MFFSLKIREKGSFSKVGSADMSSLTSVSVGTGTVALHKRLVSAPVHAGYTGYAGWHVVATIPMKFGTAHGKSRPEVGSGFPIEAYGNRGVSRPSLVIGIS